MKDSEGIGGGWVLRSDAMIAIYLLRIDGWFVVQV